MPRADRPSVLLERPEPAAVTALSPDGPVVAFSWRGLWRQVRTCVGPERISPQWWARQHADGRGGGANDPLSSRDYFKLQDADGQWVWLYRQRRDDRWFVHGLWL